jgi:hypothetical protein
MANRWSSEPALACRSLSLKASVIDKTFLIAGPMRKVSWTKRFAAGWGERRAGNGLASSEEGFFCERASAVSEKSTVSARSISEAASSLG